MKLNEKDVNQIVEMFFSTFMYSYLTKDHQFEIIASFDKTGIVERKYDLTSIKNSNSSIKRV
jgi:hypothetical protein